MTEKKKPNPIQSIIGDWQGSMKVRSDRLTLIVHIVMGKDGNLHATVDSPGSNFSISRRRSCSAAEQSSS